MTPFQGVTPFQWDTFSVGGCDIWTSDCAANTPIYPWGSEAPTPDHAVYSGAGSTLPVGSKPDGNSPYGVQDMAGNLWEWTSDWYDNGYYETSPDTNPTGPAGGTYKTIRGGSWDLSANFLRSSDRLSHYPSNTNGFFGFRCAQ